MVIFITALIESLQHVKKNWRILPITALFDFLFFFSFGIASSFFTMFSAGPFNALIESGGRLGSQIALAASKGESPLNIFLADPTVAFNVRSIFFAFLFFILLVYVVWVLFGGASWFLSYKMLDQKGLLKNIVYITKFSLVSMVWFIAYSVFLVGVMRFIGVTLLGPEQLVSSNSILSGVSVINYVLLFFVFVSLSFVPFAGIKENFKMTFTKAFTKIHVLVPMAAIIALVFYVNFKLSFLLFEPILTNATSSLSLPLFLSIVARFLIAAPFLVWARMYGILVAKKISVQH